MPSPFPGMDPFLERPNRWREMHAALIVEARYQLSAGLPDGYEVRAEEDVYLEELPPHPDPRVRLRVADDEISLTGGPVGTSPAGGASVAEPAFRTVLRPRVIERRESFLEVRDSDGREVVTVIELLSRANKIAHRDQYRQKRSDLLGSEAHLVEIDLLRAGRAHELGADAEGLLVNADTAYRCLISRADRRPQADVFPIGLRDSLPVLPIPLRGADLVPLDLRAVLDEVYDRAHLAKSIYRTPPDPPLDPADAAWAAGVLRDAGHTVPPGWPASADGS